MLRACVDEMLALRQQPDLIVLTGDLVDLGRAAEVAHLKSILAPLRQRDHRRSRATTTSAMRCAYAFACAKGYLPRQ